MKSTEIARTGTTCPGAIGSWQWAVVTEGTETKLSGRAEHWIELVGQDAVVDYLDGRGV